jgi:hypothetical protein
MWPVIDGRSEDEGNGGGFEEEKQEDDRGNRSGQGEKGGWNA